MDPIEFLTEFLRTFNNINESVETLKGQIMALQDQIAQLKAQQTQLVDKQNEFSTVLATETGELKTAFDNLKTSLADVSARLEAIEGTDIGVDLTSNINSVSDAINSVARLSDLSKDPDAETPSTPGTPTASDITASGAVITWGESTDNVGVTGYEVYENGEKVADSDTTSWTASGWAPSTNYVISVRSKDAAGNFSAMSESVSVDTLAE